MERELPVSVWPEWKITEKIGEGSFGKVYKAQRTEKGHSFYSAIKIIAIPSSKSELNSVRSETANENSTREYFESIVEECIQEVSTMEYFRGNSHIVSVEDFKVVEYLDEIGWDISIRMEYLTSFTDYCAGRSLTEKETMKLGIDLCKALEYCQQLNIIHRDIKPENIFVSRFGDFKLGDFGIARELEKTMSSLSKKGTYSYMAPEMYKGERYDNSVDIYSLGIVLYKIMNKNRLPFLNLEKQLITYRDKEAALNKRMSGEKLPPPAEAGKEFGEMICRACAYAPASRYESPEAFRKELEDLYEGRKKISLGKEHLSEKEENAGNETSQKSVDLSASSYERKSRASERRRKAKKRARRRIIAVSAVVLAGCMVLGVYLKNLFEDTVRRQTEKMVELLTNEEYHGEITGEDFSSSIDTIKERATTIVNELPSYRPEGSEGSRIRYYNDDGEIMKVLVYPSLSEDGKYEEYYYWNGALFFAYIWEGDTSELYYYRDGIMIRWIDESGTCHDNELDNPEYVERGDKYWNNSIKQLQ